MLSVVTFLWDNPDYRWNHLFRYLPGHVDCLARAVRRNLTLPHKFICVTDYPRECFDEPDEVVPLWPDYRDLGGCYVRLKAFSQEMRKIFGERFIWFDVDVVITGSLDVMLSRPEEFIAWKDVDPRNAYCGSMVMMNAGARKQVWEDFNRDTSPELASNHIGTDQAWMCYRLGPTEAVWTEADGVYSYRTHIKRAYQNALPENARVVFFHGPYDPSQPEIQDSCPWVKEHWA